MRQDGFRRLAVALPGKFARTSAMTAQVRDGASDLQLTNTYRVPFQYSRIVRQSLSAGSLVHPRPV